MYKISFARICICYLLIGLRRTIPILWLITGIDIKLPITRSKSIKCDIAHCMLNANIFKLKTVKSCLQRTIYGLGGTIVKHQTDMGLLTGSKQQVYIY
jgi:hypothetical protein